MTKKTALYLNMQILSDYLDDRFSDYLFYRNKDPMKLEDVRLFQGQQEVQEQYVYIVTPEYLEQIMETSCSMILVGKTDIPIHSIHRQSSVIYIDREENPFHILELVQDVFLKFRRWTDQLNQLLVNHATLYDYCAVSNEIFQNPMYILDAGNNALLRTSYVSGMMRMSVDPETGRLLLPVERRNLHSHTKEFLETYNTRKAHYWTPEWNKHRDIYINIFDDNQRYLGRILINELRSSIKPSQLRLLEYFSVYIAEAFKLLKKEDVQTENPFVVLLSHILFGRLDAHSDTWEQLEQKGWHQEGCYLVASTPLAPLDSGYTRSICLSIMENINDSVAFFQDEKLYVICRLPETVLDPVPYYELLHEIGLKNSIHFGASDLFYNLMRLPEYEKQAGYGRKYGLEREPDRYCHPFSHIALTYMLTHATGSLPMNVVCSSAIRTLRKIDREKNTDYYHTLEEYIKSGCQPVQAAKTLFLHRGTLTYRLKKIQAFTNLDLEDSDTVFYLNLSYRVYELFQ